MMAIAINPIPPTSPENTPLVDLRNIAPATPERNPTRI